MAESAIEWLNWLDRAYAADFAPLLARAAERRLREYQLQDEARRVAERRADAETERAFQRERDAAQQAFSREQAAYRETMQRRAEVRQEAHEERMVDIRAASARKEYERQYEFLDTAKKKEMRETELRKARALGISAEELADNASIGDIAEAQARSHGRQLIAAAKTVSQSLQRYAQAKGESIQQITHGAITQAIGNLTDKDLKAAKMTRADLNQLLTTGKFEELRAKALREKNNAAFDLLNRIDAESSAIIKDGMEKLERNKPELEGLAKGAAMAKDNFDALVKQGNYDEASSREASEALLGGVFQPQQSAQPAPAQNRTPMPDSPQYWPEGMPTGNTAPVPVGQTGWPGLSNLPAAAFQAARSVPAAVASRLPSLPDASGVTAFPAEAARYAWSGGTPPTVPPALQTAAGMVPSVVGAAADPRMAFWKVIMNKIAQGQSLTPQEQNTALRLQTTIQDQTAAQNALAPTAFPALPPVFTGAP